jgi:hypothetical protein
MASEQKLVVDDIHPGRMRSQSNSGESGFVLSTAAIAETEKLEKEVQVMVQMHDSNADLYPGARREIENTGDTLHRNALHKLEAEHPALPALSPKLTGVPASDLYPAIKAGNLGTDFSTHSNDVKEAKDRLGPEPPQLDLYPAMLAGNTGLEQTLKHAAPSTQK